MIRELKTLVAVAREGTFAAAGDKIGLTQAAVSAQMKRLESELGFRLFERTGRSARLNARGRQTLTQAEELLRLYRNLGSPVSVGLHGGYRQLRCDRLGAAIDVAGRAGEAAERTAGLPRARRSRFVA